MFIIPTEEPMGGYVPFVELPCELEIGETAKWITVISASPITCVLIPWLCCPVPFVEDAPGSISSDISCEERGALYGAAIFWTMQAVSIVGLVLAISTLSQCAFNYSFIPNMEIGDAIYSIDIPERLQILIDLPNEIKLGVEDFKENILPTETSLFIKQNMIDYLSDYFQFKNNGTTSIRKKRQADLNIPIPTSLSFYLGRDDAPDGCDRDEVPFPDGDCHQILSEGPCDETEFVLMDPRTRFGYCAPRLCSPDRVFVFSDQLCHDPLENGICPSGRRLFTSSFGTPTCGCPDGMYESDDDFDNDDDDDDICQPILDDIEDCPSGQVFWFKNFRSPPQCVSDPCNGQNIKKGPKELPFVPSLFDGKCYQLGQGHPVCRREHFYTVDMETLLGECSSLEESGFTVLDSGDLDQFKSLYGDPLPKGDSDGSSIPTTSHFSTRPRFPSFPSVDKNSISSDEKFVPQKKRPSHKHTIFPFKNPFFQKKRPSSSSKFPMDNSIEEEHFNFISSNRFPASTVAIRPRMPAMGSSVVPSVPSSRPSPPALLVGQSVVGHFGKTMKNMIPHFTLVPTHMTAFSPPFITVNGSISLFNVLHGAFGKSHHRSKRAPLPYSAPGNIFQPGLTSCKAGATRDLNFKCRNRITPSVIPNSRPRRKVSPTPPTPSCNGGNVFGSTRSCTSTFRASNSLRGRIG